jgi:hypothetical protein
MHLSVQVPSIKWFQCYGSSNDAGAEEAPGHCCTDTITPGLTPEHLSYRSGKAIFRHVLQVHMFNNVVLMLQKVEGPYHQGRPAFPFAGPCWSEKGNQLEKVEFYIF